jgi:hypothetical protein
MNSWPKKESVSIVQLFCVLLHQHFQTLSCTHKINIMNYYLNISHQFNNNYKLEVFMISEVSFRCAGSCNISDFLICYRSWSKISANVNRVTMNVHCRDCNSWCQVCVVAVERLQLRRPLTLCCMYIVAVVPNHRTFKNFFNYL